jgi:DNA-binding PucR family transcriptional regulator
VRYSDVSVVSLMTVDLARAREFVRDELGGLAGTDERARALRETLEVYLDEGGRWRSTADRLGVHENMVVNRVRRAEELIGREIAARRFEIEAALRLARVVAGRARPGGDPA